jgi:hypothetical protein
VRNGWPPDIAFNLDDDYALAFIIQNGESEGGSFNFSSMRWEKPKS